MGRAGLPGSGRPCRDVVGPGRGGSIGPGWWSGLPGVGRARPMVLSDWGNADTRWVSVLLRNCSLLRGDYCTVGLLKKKRKKWV